MDIFTIIGIAGGVIVAVVAILLANYNKKKDKNLEEKEIRDTPKKESSGGESSQGSVQAQTQSPAATPQPTQNKASSKQTRPAPDVPARAETPSMQTPVETLKNKAIAEEKEEEKDVSLEMESYKHVLTLVSTINAAFSDLDKLAKEEHFYNLLKNKELSKSVIEHITGIKEIYSEINKEAKELKKKTTDMINTNKQLLLDAKKLIEIDDKKFEKYEKDLLEDAIKLVNEFETTLSSSKKLEDSSANCINFCNNIIQLCNQIPDDETNFAFNLSFGKKGTYEQLKKEHESLLSLHYSSILTLKKIEQLLSKIKKTLKSSNAA